MNPEPLPWLTLKPIAYLLFCVSMAALLAFPCYLALGRSGNFHMLVNRGAMVAMFLGMWAWRSRVAISMNDLGIVRPNRQLLLQIRDGFGYGALMLLLHILLLLALNERFLKLATVFQWESYPRWIFKSAITALSVGVTEELLFRGFLLSYLRRGTSRAYAIALSGIFFAVLHFVKTDMRPSGETVQWYSGVMMVWDALRHLGEMEADAFFALLSAGVFLACIRTFVPLGLGYCIGVHAGWVFIVKMAKYVTRTGPESENSLWVSDYDGTIGLLSCLWLSALTFAMIRHWKTRFAMNPTA